VIGLSPLFLEVKIEQIQKQIHNKATVVCAVSGGVDSTVVAAIINKAVGPSFLKCIFVDTGLLRKDDVKHTTENFNNQGIPLIYLDKQELFLKRLEGVSDPEQKRKIIGRTFIEVFEEEAKKLKTEYDVEYLAQGTLYPDVIESVNIHGSSVTIKSHHNVGGLPEVMNLKLIEPLKELFKDEVRILGKKLGLPDHVLHRHPFPGPGLAIRIPGEISLEKIRILQDADEIFMSELTKENLYDKIWQAFAVLLPVKSVGVMGDKRSYDHVCALRAITSTDGMTADVYPLSMEFLLRVSNEIVNCVRGINRVVFDVTSKPPATIEWE